MTTRTRTWLRGFLRLDARAEKDNISSHDIRRQENTVLHALDLLEEQSGAVLADEVGMGKTYEALGVAAAIRHNNRYSRIVIVTPGPDLNRKWIAEFPRFSEMYDFDNEIAEVSSLSDFVKAVRSRKFPIVVAPITIFQSGRGHSDQVYLLSLYFYWKGLHGNTANAIMRRYRDGTHKRLNVESHKFLGVFRLNQSNQGLSTAFQRGRGKGSIGLDELYEGGGVGAFENEYTLRKALYRARFVLTGSLMPILDLLIVDEAHKLKNPSSLRTLAMHHVFAGRYNKALFLTATPFQLDIWELRQIFSLIAGANGAPHDLNDQVEELLGAVSEYQSQYDTFQHTWASLDRSAAETFRSLYDHDSSMLDNSDDRIIEIIQSQVSTLKNLKSKTIEPGFRKWMIRSLRDDKRNYRNSVNQKLHASGADMLPFLIYERFIAELFRQGQQTHKAAVEINMVSSYQAARNGTLLSSESSVPGAADSYRTLLLETIELMQPRMDHPKISNVIEDARDAAIRGQKTLVFCSRVATLFELRRELEAVWESHLLARWRRVFPDATRNDIFGSKEEKGRRGRHSLLQSRFHRTQDMLYLALRESYLRTLVPLADWAIERLPDVVGRANELLRKARVGKTAAGRVNYQLAKRCIEKATAELWLSSKANTSTEYSAARLLLNEDYVRLGLDLQKDEFEDDSIGNECPRWNISERVAQIILVQGGSLWVELAKFLNAPTFQSGERRVRIVEQLARYLTYGQVTFLSDMLIHASRAGLSMDPMESSALLEYIPSYWESNSGQQWLERLGEFLKYFCDRDGQQQEEILDGAMRTIQFARHTRDGARRERLRESFNTPLYPMVLIANEVMQEGLDLHKQCRRVVHHDLVWNPAQIEQRIGRIDRLGSLTSRLRQNDTNVSLDIFYPVIRGTIDERIFRTVKGREKWLEFLLGATPNFSAYRLADEDPPPLPDQLGKDLAIDLSPK